MHHLRRINPEELPETVDILTGETRRIPAIFWVPSIGHYLYQSNGRIVPEQTGEWIDNALLQFGLMRVARDLYDCAHVDGDPEPPWGERVTHSPDRYHLPPSIFVSRRIRWTGELALPPIRRTNL